MSRRLLLVMLLGLYHCQPRRGEPSPVDPPAIAAAASASPPEPPPPLPSAALPATFDPAAVFVERYAEEDAYVVRGSRAKAQAILFGGQCAHPQGYADAIKIAAARRVQLVALQGDAPCGGVFRSWSFDLPALSRRIERTFRALGFGEPRDVLLIGYSQGALLAERLAAFAPERFTRFVLMASPRAITGTDDVAAKGPLCVFPGSAKAALDKVKQHSQITVSGVVDGEFFGRPKLKDCKLE